MFSLFTRFLRRNRVSRVMSKGEREREREREKKKTDLGFGLPVTSLVGISPERLEND